MSAQTDRIVALETHRAWHWWAIGLIATVGFGWLYWLSNGVMEMKGDIRAIKQKIADGGNGAIVTALQHPSSPQQLAANLALVSSQVRVAHVEGRPPDQAKIEALDSAVEAASVKDPAMPEVWHAVAELASFRSSAVLNGKQLPDCQTDVKPRLLTPAKDVPELSPMPDDLLPVNGYIFRNCSLHMDRLPKGILARGFLTSPLQAVPSRGAPAHAAGEPYASGVVAFLVNCEIVVNDAGISESDIVVFFATNCRMKYEVNLVPSGRTQTLLRASLGGDPGSLNVRFS